MSPFKFIGHFLRLWHEFEKEVEYVKIPFAWGLADDSALFQKEVPDWRVLNAHGFGVDFNSD